uniref:ATP synthase subunit b n=1 Tax=Roseihalotalea indica TaxID=2867963 RepID=A0AA49GNN0_9BACT|nr:F0F1 ATP synthase subunit B [Tunicatimonas sp. TK19036]
MDLISPDSGLIIWQLLIFLAVLFILGKFAWKPILTALNERESSIEEALASAERAKEEMKQLQASNQQLLAEARKERETMLKEANAAAGKIKDMAREEGERERKRMVEDASAEIENQKKAALAEVKQQVAELSVQIAEKILRENLKGETAQKSYIDKLVSDLNRN